MPKITITEIVGLAGVLAAIVYFPVIILFFAGLPIWILLGFFAVIYLLFFKKRGKRK